MNQNNLIKSIHVVAWYPEQTSPHAGVFIKEHIRSVSLFSETHVIFLKFSKNRWLPKISITKETQELTKVYYVHVYSPVRRFGTHDFLVKKAYQKALNLINKFKEADIYHIHVRNKYTKLFTDISIVNLKPIVVTEHFSFYHTGIKLLPQKEQDIQRREITDWFNKTAIKKVMPVSRELGKVLINQFGVDKILIEPIPNIAYKSFYFEPKKIDRPVLIVLVANWQSPKNPILFFKSLLALDLELINSVKVDVVGIGFQLDEMKQFVDEFCSHVDISFHGLQDKDMIGDLLRKAHFLAHPTNAENLPTIIIESLCCGTPVITNRVNGIPELINETNGLMSEAKDLVGFSDNLKFMIQNHDKFHHESISINALKQFSEKEISNRIRVIYNDVI